MAVVAGIDEAGLGPVLGPLVVSAAAFDVPDDRAADCLWTLLATAVARTSRRKHSAVAIGDSKKLFHRDKPDGLQHLERAVLAMLATRGLRPAGLHELLARIAPRAVEELRGYPWYAGRDLPLPHCITATDAALAGNALAVAMRSAGVQLRGLRSEPLFVGEYNRLVEATNNKCSVAFGVTARLLMRVWETTESGAIYAHVDRQGGRMRYLRHLQTMFEGCGFKVLQESDECSAYRICDRKRTMDVCFRVRGESHHLAVALASMASKYLRELFMERINAFWASHMPGLKPTAGYYTDGHRFLTDIAEALAAAPVDTSLLQRSR